LQEYFAAKQMDLRFRDGKLKAETIWPPGKWWERTNWEVAAVLFAGLYNNDCTKAVEWIAEANPEVAAQCVAQSGVGHTLADAARERLRTQWIHRLTDVKNDPPQARAAVGRALALTEWDNRKGVGIVGGLPDIDCVKIPGGEFKCGDESEDDNKPRALTLPEFYISRFPVTNAQFNAFLDDPTGYADPRWFAGLAADDDDRRVAEPYFKFANHPRDNINWYQAMAFCRWLSWRWGGGYDLKKIGEWAVRLPTEFEWEKAARGTDGRIYPYGNQYVPAKGNADYTGIGQTSAVGIFPDGKSPYGVEEMSGNVWEWCLSRSDNPALDAKDENLQSDNDRALRGGAWWDDQDSARSVRRDIVNPAVRDLSTGFRLWLSRPPSS